MSYYRGDYYAGGIGSFFKGIAKAAVGFIPGVGPLASKVLSAIPTGAAKSGAVASAAGAGMAMVKAGAGAIRSGIVKHPVLSAAGAAGGGLAIGAIGRGGAAHPQYMAGLPSGAPERGYHLSKKTGMYVRNRRMNPCNGRALSRATRRLHAFARRYRKVVGFVSPHPKKGRMYFKKRSRSKK